MGPSRKRPRTKPPTVEEPAVTPTPSQAGESSAVTTNNPKTSQPSTLLVDEPDKVDTEDTSIPLKDVKTGNSSVNQVSSCIRRLVRFKLVALLIFEMFSST